MCKVWTETELPGTGLGMLTGADTGAISSASSNNLAGGREWVTNRLGCWVQVMVRGGRDWAEVRGNSESIFGVSVYSSSKV